MFIITPEMIATSCPSVQCPYCLKNFTLCFDCGKSIEGGHLCKECAIKRKDDERKASEQRDLLRMYRESDFD